MKIRIAGIVPESVVDAPGGISYTIFAQGCLHNCVGCHNPSTHNVHGGQVIDCSFILDDIKKYPLSKIVTFSGGDPFLQSEPFWHLARQLKEKDYKIVAYSGFYFDDMLDDIQKVKLLNQVDVLIDGPFIESKKNLDLSFRGSSNQRIIDVKETFKKGSICILTRYY